MMRSFVISIGISITIQAKEPLQKLLHENPFKYNLDVKIVSGKKKSDNVTICCHGYGHNNQIVDVVNSHAIISSHDFKGQSRTMRPFSRTSRISFLMADVIPIVSNSLS